MHRSGDFKEQGELSGITSEAAVKPDGKEYVQPAETIHMPCRAQAVEDHYEAKLAFFEAKVESLSRACAQEVGVQTEADHTCWRQGKEYETATDGTFKLHEVEYTPSERRVTVAVLSAGFAVDGGQSCSDGKDTKNEFR